MERFLLIIGFCLSLFTVSANDNREKYNHYFLRANNASMANSDSLLYYAKQLQDSKNQYLHLYGRLSEAKYYYKLKEYGQAEQILNALIQEVEEKQMPESFYHLNAMPFDTYEASITHLLINIYTRFFYMRRNQARLNEAYDYLMLKDSIFDQFTKRDNYYELGKIKIAREKGVIKREVGLLSESLDLMLPLKTRIEALLNQTDDPLQATYHYEYTNILSEIAMSYQKLAQEQVHFADSALYFYEQAYLISIAKDTDERSLRMHKRAFFVKRSNLKRIKQEFDLALNYLDTVASLGGVDQTYLFCLKTLCFQGLHEHDSVFYYGKKYLKSKKYPIYKRRIYDALSESYFAIGEPDSAYKYAALTLETTKVDSKSIQRTLIDENKNNKVLTNKVLAERFKTSVFLYLVSALLIASLGFFIYYARRKRKKNKESYQLLYRKYMELKLETNTKGGEPYSKKPIKHKKINNTLKQEVLEGLKKIEQSELFLNEEFNSTHLAKILNTNTSYLSKIINNEKGKSFSEYLLGLRMEALIKKLDEVPKFRKYSVEALATFAGYKNASSFSRAFKAYTHTSPYKYIKTKYPIVDQGAGV